jgi:glycosyltransferase involved in cell wall biosynthesis
LGIPYIFLNHFSNDAFTNVSIREQLIDAVGIAGVSGFAVPRWLKGRFCNLSDGIDTEIFNPVNARPLGIETNIPIIIYPARITRVKGQSDLIKAYVKLRNGGLRAKVVFAGRTDSTEYEKELKELVRKKGLMDDVLFIGQLNTEELRDWYGHSSVMAFPTYHQEGLGRITVEAQAMKVPPVAYIIGGTPEGIQDGKTGFLIRKGDIQAFTERLRELLTDETKRKTMGEEGRRFVEEKYSLDALAQRHEEFYLKVLSNARTESKL